MINLVLAFIIIFLERNRRSASSTWASFVLFVLPLIGFILYLFLAELFQKKNGENNGKELDTFKSVLKDQVKQFDAHNYQTDNQQVTKHRDLIRMLLNKQDAFLTENNHIDLFTDGHKLYEKVIEDIITLRTTYI